MQPMFYQLHRQQHYKEGIDRVQNVVCQMVPQRVQPPDGVVNGMRDPGEGVPVANVEPKKCPLKEFTIESLDIRVLKNIEIIIPVNEIISKGRKIDKKGQKGDCSR